MASTYHRSLTIDHTKCGSSNSSNFPVLVKISDATLKDAGNGGHVQSSVGADILFYSDSAEATQIASELDYYDNVNGVLWAWVKVGTVSSSVDTVIYVFYGNGSPPARTTNPWDANFKLVSHLGNGTTLAVADSTSNAIAGTNDSATAAAGQVDGGAAFNGTSQDAFFASSAALDVGSGDFTIECWFKVTAIANGYQVMIGKDVSGSRNWTLSVNQSGTSKLEWFDLPGVVNALSATTIANATWYHGCARRSGTTVQIFLNGAADGSTLTNSTNFAATGKTYLARREYAAFEQWFGGSIDEVRFSNAARSADWILTGYNNQQNPATFITIGSELSGGGGNRPQTNYMRQSWGGF